MQQAHQEIIGNTLYLSFPRPTVEVILFAQSYNSLQARNPVQKFFFLFFFRKVILKNLKMDFKEVEEQNLEIERMEFR